MSSGTVIVLVIASVVGGFLIRRNPKGWRVVLQLLLAIGAIVWALVNDGFIWAVVVGITVFIAQGILMGIFRYSGINRLAKQMRIQLNKHEQE